MADPQRKYTDSGFAWIVTLMAFLSSYAGAANLMMIAIILPDLLDYFQVSQAMIGLAGSLKLFVCDISSGVVIGPLTKRVGCRPLAMMGLLLSAAGSVSAAYVTNYYLFLFTFSVIAGCGFAGNYIASLVIVHQYHNKRRALASGVATVGLSLGTFTFPVLVRLTIESHGWRASLVMLAAVQTQMLVAAMMFMPNPDHKLSMPNKKSDTELTAPSPDGSSQDLAQNSKQNKCKIDCTIFKNLGFILFLFGYPFADCGNHIYWSFALQRGVFQGISPLHGSAILSSYGCGSIVGRLSTGFIGNMKCTRRDLQAAGCVFAAGCVSFMSTFAGDSLVLHVAATGCFGLMYGGFHGSFSTLLVDLVGMDELPRAVGIAQLAKCVVAAASLPIAGHLFDATQSYLATYLLSGAFMITASVLLAISGIANKRRTIRMSSEME
ncbi:hypothetical protein CAPTEDRAFT_224661 [Capitella teleta]|uniref:Major facilitator superfamily (MFS) profile domain-containing protein n=1 Tax=Capitella teleta TaxID=283909 RepID=R7VHK2_CAPTE|nr:hypothetical protein CAPTEDRAFT_224661 [Capitella teleta]|eukprot:ELU18318.1 hypothetical protein CAPTEDRAFT_224661 [Capitella teleta]